MLKFGNREFRNLQEQVLKNMQNIANLKEGTAVLSEFGIKVVGEVDSLQDLPSVIDYKTAHEDWEYGDAFAIGTQPPYTLVILTRANDEITADHWFDIGDFPAPGPQGATGPQGEVGPQGQTGDQGPAGVDAGFGSVLATAQTLPAGSPATVTVTASGPNTAKEFSFVFGLPRGADGGNPVWGNIQGTLSDQTDLQDALDDKQDTLVSGTNIKTINNQSLVGSGNVEIVSGVWGNITGTLSDQTDLANALAEKQPVIDASHKLSASYVSGLADVATTGAYSDLSGRPTIGEGTITIKKNGETVDSFGVNQVASQNINITVPTKTSDLSNDSDFANKTYVDDGLALKQDVISDLSDIRAGAALGDTAVQPATLQTELATKQDVISDLATIRSGAAAGATAVQPAAIANMVTTNTQQTISGQKTFSGALSATNTVYVSGGSFKTSDTTDLEVEKTLAHTGWPIQDGSSSDYKATYFSNGVYIEDLEEEDEDAPYYLAFPASDGVLAIKTDIGNATLTIQKNGTTVDTFGANAKTSKTINITVPTDNNELTNGAGYITSSAIPTNVSAFTNDAGYITASAIPANIVTYTGSSQAAGTVSIGTVDLGTSNSIYTSTSESTDYYNLTLDTEDTDDSDPHYIKLHDGWRERHSGDWYDCLQSTYIRQPKYAEYNDNDHLYLELPRGSFDSANPKVIATTDQIPTVGSGVLTIQKNGTNVDTFSANASSNKTINITVPTNNNELTNGAGYQTASDVSTAIAGQTKETWTFTLLDGTTVTKTVVLG